MPYLTCVIEFWAGLTRKVGCSMKAKVNASLCAGTGLCEQTCPQVFRVVDGVSTIQVDEVPSDAEKDCRRAVEECPTAALSIED